MGAAMCMLFTATHPEMVRRLVMIDSFKPMSRENSQVVDFTRLSGNILVKRINQLHFRNV